jgi:hypothetical protein
MDEASLYTKLTNHGAAEFKQRLDLLKRLPTIWRAGKDCSVINTETIDDESVERESVDQTSEQERAVVDSVTHVVMEGDDTVPDNRVSEMDEPIGVTDDRVEERDEPEDVRERERAVAYSVNDDVMKRDNAISDDRVSDRDEAIGVTGREVEERGEAVDAPESTVDVTVLRSL